MFTQQPVHSNPRGPVGWGGEIPPQTTPGIGEHPVLGANQPRPDRVQVHVIADRLEVPVAAALDDQGLVPAAEYVPGELAPVVQAPGVAAQKPAHPGDQVGVGGLDDQVKLVPHQAVSMHLETGLLTRFRQRLEEVLPIHVVVEDVFPPITPAEHMINGPGKLHSDSARHEPQAGERRPPPSSACYSLTPAPIPVTRTAPADGPAFGTPAALRII
jgi:sorbitol-specific phosphotransferase system component IIA